MNVALVLTALFLIRLVVPLLLLILVGSLINKRQVQLY
jgi:hypothetical protein